MPIVKTNDAPHWYAERHSVPIFSSVFGWSTPTPKKPQPASDDDGGRADGCARFRSSITSTRRAGPAATSDSAVSGVQPSNAWE